MSKQARKVHNKLVRDKIPEYLENKGIKAEIRVLDSVEYDAALAAKQAEEFNEQRSAKTLSEAAEEFADELEVLRARIAFVGLSLEEIEEIRVKKYKERGGFTERILLIETYEG